MILLTRKAEFSSAHFYWNDALSPEENHRLFGKCANRNGHGHNYTVTVTLSGPVDPATGMVANLADLDHFAQEHLLEPFDHTNLNTLAAFASLVPTTENLTLELHRIFTAFPHAHLEHIHVEETGNNSFGFPIPDRTSF